MSRLSVVFILLALLTSAASAQGNIRVSVPSAGPVLRVDWLGFTQRPNVTGTVGTREFSIASGKLPPGMEINAADGVIFGTPSLTGDYSGVVIRVRDGSGNAGLSAAHTISVIPMPSASYQTIALAIGARAVLTPAIEGKRFTPRFALAAETLPKGMSLNINTGIISGTPTVTGTHSGLRVTMTDTDGMAGTSAPFDLEIFDPADLPPPGGTTGPEPVSETRAFFRFNVIQ